MSAQRNFGGDAGLHAPDLLEMTSNHKSLFRSQVPPREISIDPMAVSVVLLWHPNSRQTARSGALMRCVGNDMGVLDMHHECPGKC